MDGFTEKPLHKAASGRTTLKQRSSEIAQCRGERRNESIELSKSRREKLLSLKRPKGGEVHENGLQWNDEQLKGLVLQLEKSDDIISTATSLISIRRMLCCENPPIKEILDLGIVPIFMGILGDMKRTDLHYEIVWCITNIAAGTTEHSQKIIPIAPYLIMLLGSSTITTVQQAAWALGNLAADSQEHREFLMSNGIATPIVRLLLSKDTSSQQNAAFTISNLARGKNTKLKDLITAGLVPALQVALNSQNEDVVTETLWATAYLTANDEEISLSLLRGGIFAYMANYLSVGENLEQTIPVLRIVGNIAGISTDVCEELARTTSDETGFLERIVICTSSSNRAVQKESLWALSNLITSPNLQDFAIANLNILQILQQLLHAAFDIRKEAAYAIVNLILAGKYVHLIDRASVEVFVSFLRIPEMTIQQLGLSFAESFLRFSDQGPQVFEELGGVDCLEALLYKRDQPTISAWSSDLLDRYFSTEDQDPANE